MPSSRAIARIPRLCFRRAATCLHSSYSREADPRPCPLPWRDSDPDSVTVPQSGSKTVAETAFAVGVVGTPSTGVPYIQALKFGAGDPD